MLFAHSFDSELRIVDSFLLHVAVVDEVLAIAGTLWTPYPKYYTVWLFDCERSEGEFSLGLNFSILGEFQIADAHWHRYFFANFEHPFHFEYLYEDLPLLLHILSLFRLFFFRIPLLWYLPPPALSHIYLAWIWFLLDGERTLSRTRMSCEANDAILDQPQLFEINVDEYGVNERYCLNIWLPCIQTKVEPFDQNQRLLIQTDTHLLDTQSFGYVLRIFG